METSTNERPKLLVKTKSIQTVFDYCLENKLKFNAAPRLNNDEWEIELLISDIMGAVALGVFVRENKLEVIGLAKVQSVADSKIKKVVKSNSKKQESILDSTEEEEDTTDFNLPETNNTSESDIFLESEKVNDSELAF